MGQSSLAIHWPTAESLKTAGNLSQLFEPDKIFEVFLPESDAEKAFASIHSRGVAHRVSRALE